MGNFTKWLGAGLGFSLGGPIGAAIGFVAGNFVGGFYEDDLNTEHREYQKSVNQNNENLNTVSGDFKMSLLVLASIVIKSDGKVDQRELDFVRNNFVAMYGKERANSAFKLFKGIIKKEASARQVCIQIREHMSHSSRLQLIHFLFGIAKSDEFVSPSEIEEIRKIAGYLYINKKDFEYIKTMFYNESENAYIILNISEDSTNKAVKKAYRKMAKKYHPDKLQGLGEEHIKDAKEKFQSIQAAYEKIKDERGL